MNTQTLTPTHLADMTVWATTMYAAQGFKLPAEWRATMDAEGTRRRAQFRQEFGVEIGSQTFRIPVRNPRDNSLIGHLEYTA